MTGFSYEELSQVFSYNPETGVMLRHSNFLRQKKNASGECLIEAYPAHRQGAYENTDRILATLRSAGFAVVPVEPTLEMIAAWDRVARPGLHAFEIRFKAMITAAQEDSRE